MDVAQFRIDFPEFADTSVYPSSTVTFWSALGEKLISSSRLGNLYTQAVQLFTAHNIVLAAGNIATASAGGAPGAQTGPVSSKSVGSASVSYDTAATMLEGAGHWNITVYGRQYIQLVRLVCTGAVQL
jgi:hypothetical protein